MFIHYSYFNWLQFEVVPRTVLYFCQSCCWKRILCENLCEFLPWHEAFLKPPWSLEPMDTSSLQNCLIYRYLIDIQADSNGTRERGVHSRKEALQSIYAQNQKSYKVSQKSFTFWILICSNKLQLLTLTNNQTLLLKMEMFLYWFLWKYRISSTS